MIKVAALGYHYKVQNLITNHRLLHPNMVIMKIDIEIF